MRKKKVERSIFWSVSPERILQRMEEVKLFYFHFSCIRDRPFTTVFSQILSFPLLHMIYEVIFVNLCNAL